MDLRQLTRTGPEAESKKKSIASMQVVGAGPTNTPMKFKAEKVTCPQRAYRSRTEFLLNPRRNRL